MKISWRWIVAVVVLLAGLVAAAMPVVSGVQAERVFYEQVALLDAELNKELGPTARAEVTDYDRGLYSTTTQTRIQLPEALLPRDWRRAMKLEDGPVVFVLDQRLHHGLASIAFEGVLQPQGAAASLIRQLGGSDASIRLSGDIGMQDQSITVETERLSGTVDPLQQLILTLEPVRFTGHYRSGAETLETRLDWPGLVLRSDLEAASFRAEGVRAQTNVRLVAGSLFDGVWVGESRFSADQLLFDQSGLQPVALGGVNIDAHSELVDEQKLAATLTLDWLNLELPDLPTTRGAFEFKLGGVEAEALLAFSRLVETMPLDWMETASGQVALADLLVDGATVRMPVMRIESVAGQGMSGSADLLVKPLFAEQLRAGNTGLPLLLALELEAEGGIDTALIDRLPMEQQMWARQLEGFGLLRREDDQLRARTTFADGELSVNGQRWWGLGR